MDLKAFSVALLAERCWEFFRTLESLLYKVFKATYFSNEYLLQSRLGSNPSYA